MPALAACLGLVQSGYRVYPLVDHVAAEQGGGRHPTDYGASESGSSRYKDLVDLVAIARWTRESEAEPQIVALVSAVRVAPPCHTLPLRRPRPRRMETRLRASRRRIATRGLSQIGGGAGADGAFHRPTARRKRGGELGSAHLGLALRVSKPQEGTAKEQLGRNSCDLVPQGFWLERRRR